MAIAEGLMHRGVVAMSAPIFDIDGDIVATINLTGVDGVMDTRLSGPTAKALRAVAADLTHQLGNSTRLRRGNRPARR